MFSFFGHKKKDKSPSSEQHESQPPIPGPDDEFVMITRRTDAPYPPTSSGAPVFPSIGTPNPLNSSAVAPKKEVGFLQGVPFSLHKEFSSNNQNDILALQLSEIMAYCTRRLNVDTVDYEFTVEKSVIREES